MNTPQSSRGRYASRGRGQRAGNGHPSFHGRQVGALRQRETAREPAPQPPSRLGQTRGFWQQLLDKQSFLVPCLFRVILFCVFLVTEEIMPFMRLIHPEEVWLYQNPIPETPFLEEFGGPKFKGFFDPMPTILYPIVFIFLCMFASSSSDDAIQALCAYTLAVPVTGIVVNTIKIFAGRPRPDFMARCYGVDYYQQYTDLSRECIRDDSYLYDGRKSFPSGHTALAACCFGFLALYLSGLLKTFHDRSKYKLTGVMVILPLIMMAVVAGISRTCDYKHHWQDVLIGGLIGFGIVYLCYRVYFPPLTHENCDFSLESLENRSFERAPSSVQQVYHRPVTFTTSEEEEPENLDRNNPRRPYLPRPSFL